jgi:flagellar motility protein MotE (MotC chaperone)
MAERREPGKAELVEKIVFAVMPILFSCVVYLLSALSAIKEDVTVLNGKISLVVTSDNKQASNSGAELAREKLRQDLEKEIQKNRDDIAVNRQDIALLNERMKQLQQKQIGAKQ